MNKSLENIYDVAVIGGGHAGVEAALAVARMGKTAALITMDANRLALMSCNPAIGGIAKSHVVKEVDALGGLMGRAIDATGIQFRRLNLSRGPAVWSTRVQADRIAYTKYVSDLVGAHKNVTMVEDVAGELLADGTAVCGVRTEQGEIIRSRAVIVTTGTFLAGLIHIGEKKIKAGRMDEQAAYELSKSLLSLGFELGRLKTGTPPRLDGDTVNWEKCEKQQGHEPIPFFSYSNGRRKVDQVACYLTKTTAETKRIISANFGRSPIFSGQITSTGPRYCPSIEAKFHRFADKESHQIFLEPEGNGTNEIYPNGFSTALPEEVQNSAIRTVVGLEHAKITRPGYAIEYDYSPAYQIKPSLETRRVRGLFFAGQINGTSGYEEAAGQGLMAGINAVLYIEHEPPFVLDRSEAYIGVMIDDLTTRSTTEPYRLFTSRAEYRLALREDNARDRLFGYAKKYGLIPEGDFAEFEKLKKETEGVINRLRRTRIKVADLGDLGIRFKKTERISLENLLKQPNITINEALPFLKQADPALPDRHEVLERAAIFIRYSGYIGKQKREIEKFRRMEEERIPFDFDYETVSGLKVEAREKFLHFRPASLGQAGRIEGVSPGDIAVLSVYLMRHKGAD
ncbi:MAG: tRNA uridine-5-carboxymethylaminomethyl(34) synthesis enzyme MnmG [candidate division Zixibacteria bacterium]|nr:tRNA uridine-5-carboxymethylaminomethyl(34) synthesis enzyme MnmG [candidate division Zixibacteria bacterium]